MGRVGLGWGGGGGGRVRVLVSPDVARPGREIAAGRHRFTKRARSEGTSRWVDGVDRMTAEQKVLG
jgi:hypothetical protein